jgi:hypothetical protein
LPGRRLPDASYYDCDHDDRKSGRLAYDIRHARRSHPTLSALGTQAGRNWISSKEKAPFPGLFL